MVLYVTVGANHNKFTGWQRTSYVVTRDSAHKHLIASGKCGVPVPLDTLDLASVRRAVMALEYILRDMHDVEEVIIYTDSSAVANAMQDGKGRIVSDIRRRARALGVPIHIRYTVSDRTSVANMLAAAAQSPNYQPPTPKQYELFCSCED